MEKELLKKIFKMLISIGIVVLCVLSFVVYVNGMHFVQNSVDTMMHKLTTNLSKYEELKQDKVQSYKEDYENRLDSINFMLQKDEYFQTDEGIKEMMTLMNVTSIYAVDKEGYIVLSSEEEMLHVNLLKYKEAEAFHDMILGTSQEPYVVLLDSKNILEDDPKDFFGVSSLNSQFSMIQIGVNQTIYNKVLDNVSVDKILNDIVTDTHAAIFAIKDDQQIKQDGITLHDDEIQQLVSMHSNTAQSMTLANKRYYVKTITQNGVIWAVCVEMSNTMQTVLLQIFFFMMILIIFFIILYFVIKVFFHHNVYLDLQRLKDNIKKLNDGDELVEFVSCHPQFDEINACLDNLKNSYRYKEDRLDKIIKFSNIKLATFECLEYIHKNFVSGDLKGLLGIDEDMYQTYMRNTKLFKSYITELLKMQNEQGIVQIQDKYVSIYTYERQQEFFGCILDRTEDVNQQNYIKNHSQKDGLTGVWNRQGFEERVKQILEKDNRKGALMILDLDNFKQVNDQLGHPTGDKVLQILAISIGSVFSTMDIIGRIGGDEFVVFLPYVDSVDTLTTRVEKTISVIREDLKEYYELYSLSVSIGVAVIDERITTYDLLYKSADVALYIAKKAGKDGYYMNEHNILCMRGKCINCTKDCERKKLLGL